MLSKRKLPNLKRVAHRKDDSGLVSFAFHFGGRVSGDFGSAKRLSAGQSHGVETSSPPCLTAMLEHVRKDENMMGLLRVGEGV